MGHGQKKVRLKVSLPMASLTLTGLSQTMSPDLRKGARRPD
jgi:hypothetical protein